MHTKLLFHNRLLPFTIKHASRVPFYARHWPRLTTAIENVEQLGQLPVVNKAILQGAPDFLFPGLAAETLIHSSGTTGAPFIRFRSGEELRAVEELAGQASRLTLEEAIPRIVFTTAHPAEHGGGVRYPSNSRVLHISTLTDEHIAASTNLLMRRPVMPGAEGAGIEVHGKPRHLAILARECLLRAPEGPRKDINRITSVGYPLSRSLRGLLSRSFPSARINETYSLSEVISGGTRCEICDGIHLAAPLVGEIVGVDDDSSTSEAVGRLVITELYPYSQLQPLIRYDTGDLVRRVESKCGDPFTFQYVGRQAHTPLYRIGGRARAALSIWELSQVIEEFFWVARSSPATRLSAAYDDLPYGPPMASAALITDDGANYLQIDVGVNFPLLLFPQMVASAQRGLEQELEKVDACFRATIEHGIPARIRLLESDRFPVPISRGK